MAVDRRAKLSEDVTASAKLMAVLHKQRSFAASVEKKPVSLNGSFRKVRVEVTDSAMYSSRR